MKQGQSSIEVSSALHDAILNYECPRIKRLLPAIGGLNAIAQGLPDRYHWRFKSAEAFQSEAARIPRGGDAVRTLNTLYWRDTLGSLEAYSVMAVWRMIDLGQAAVRLIEAENIVPACIIARSALESAIQFVHDARTMSSTLEDVAKADLARNVATSTELEAFILQTVFASRQSGADEIYKSKNILTVIDKIAKVAKADPLKERYEVLCEVTHPNFLGRSLHIVDVQKGTRDGDELRVIGHQNGLSCETVMESALWSLSWAIEGQSTSVHLLQNSIRNMFETFDFLGSPPGTIPPSGRLH